MADNNTYTPYTLADIERYLQGRMNAREMHDIEKAALQDPFLSDSIEGYRQASFATTRNHLNEISASLTAKNNPAKVITMPVKRTGLWIKLSVAAALLGIVTVTWVLVDNNRQKTNYSGLVNIPATLTDSQDAAKQDTTVLAQNIQKATPGKVAQQKTAFTKTGQNGNDDEKKAAAKQPVAIASKPAGGLNNDINTRQKTPDTLNSQAFAAIGPPLGQTAGKTAYAPIEKPAGPIQSDSIAFASIALKKDNITRGRQRSNAGPLNIKLTPIPGFDSTIAITYLNNKNTTDKIIADTSLFPQGGWESFRDYVARQLHGKFDTTSNLAASGDVELEFTIDDLGNARDVKVTKSLNRQSDAAAMALIKKWPSWITTRKNKKGKVVIQF